MPRKAAKTVLPERMPRGEDLTDMAKQRWGLGPSIGTGGFGEIYSACEYLYRDEDDAYEYVIKIEPHGNGPLFCEMHFFMRNAKWEMIRDWCGKKKLKRLGMPRYIGSGSHEYNGKKYRFLVMDRYGTDLWKLFLENNRKFPPVTVYRVGLQILDTLEYIHHNGYVHADIKGANILLGVRELALSQVYLVDYGLATHYTKKDFKPDPKKAHNGTIEYTSRDAHDGVPTRRGDIEILLYNMMQWMGCELPWEGKSPETEVQNSKRKYMDDPSLLLSTCFGKSVPAGLSEFLAYVCSLKYDTEPDYKKIRAVFTKAVKTLGGSLTSALNFKATGKHKGEEGAGGSETPEKRAKMSSARRGASKPKRKARGKDSEESAEEEPEVARKPARRAKKPVEASDTENEPAAQTKKPKTRAKQLRKTSGSSSENEEAVADENRKKGGAKKPKVAETNGYNAEMLRLKQKIAERKGASTRKKVQGVSSSSGPDSNGGTPLDPLDDDIIEATPPERTPNRRRPRNPAVNGQASDGELTPRTLRRRR